MGVAADIAGSGNHPEAQPVVYLPHAQAPVGTMSFLLRTRVAPASVGPIAERTLWSTGRLMNVYRIMTLEQVVEEGRWQSRFTMILLTLFAALALILATAGIYAVISYLTLQRTREIGIRMALGARPADVLRMVTGQGVALAAVGVVFGMIASLAAGRCSPRACTEWPPPTRSPWPRARSWSCSSRRRPPPGLRCAPPRSTPRTHCAGISRFSPPTDVPLRWPG